MEQLVAQGLVVKSFATSFVACFCIALLPCFSMFLKVAIVLQIPLSTIKKKKSVLSSILLLCKLRVGEGSTSASHNFM